jgi:hypothetical protein
MIRLPRPLARVLAMATLVLGASSLFASTTDPAFVRVPSTGTASLSGSATIGGLLGGSLKVGRYTVTVPPGAYLGTATITIKVPDPTVLRCDLSISPASANHFLVPVTLVADASGANGISLISLQTVTLNETTGVWGLVPNVSVNVLNQRVYTPLFHFSKYGIVGGKGGW